jgi:hypothetical protein
LRVREIGAASLDGLLVLLVVAMSGKVASNVVPIAKVPAPPPVCCKNANDDTLPYLGLLTR